MIDTTILYTVIVSIVVKAGHTQHQDQIQNLLILTVLWTDLPYMKGEWYTYWLTIKIILHSSSIVLKPQLYLYGFLKKKGI